MSFQPVLPTGGYAGWRFLARTQEAQQAAFAQGAATRRAAEHFRAHIAEADTAAELVADRRLREVALGAFGLLDDVDARALIERVLAEGTLDPGALANRLSDPRYRQLAEAFDYGNLGVATGISGFADRILARYEAQMFQVAVGEQDDSMRLAMNVEGAVTEIVRGGAGARAQWFQVLGNPPLRAVFEGALGLPQAIGALDIDRQLDAFQERALATFGTDEVADFADPEAQERLIRLFLLRAETQASAATPAAMALQLLQA